MTSVQIPHSVAAALPTLSVFDIEALLENLVPRARQDRERMLLALLGPRTEQIPFDGGRLCLGQWQRVLLFCIDGDTRAEYTLTLLG